MDQTLHEVATKKREEIKEINKQKMARRYSKGDKGTSRNTKALGG